ncbi:helix-turn-helix domain-containing protein [Corynebacterium heidelbergense]|uniref:DNA-binding protein n=1 Tax=Corynebacterium heidelbergense TaxID=2055947 RepID=A0A364VDN9_9CORY|nr:helix-turn-helix domain-containing protein [Corynebacterium heidelbergense]RAV34765.1 DNA-binding protein [Corynebacterium heidelbergense]WCZ37028.1 Helix-turn-helix domain protein [Corynebacterium heidelbergense]
MPSYRRESAAPYLSLHEASELGYGGYSTLRKYISDGRLPHHRLGRRIRVRRGDLDALLTSADCDPVDAAIDRLLAAAPPLTAEQTRRLRDLLEGA